MTRILFFVLFLFIFADNGFSQTPPECDRSLIEDMAAYKDACSPEEFHYEAFSWEAADVAVLASMLLVAGVFSVRHQPKCRFTFLTVIALLYFGIFRGGCICPVGSTSNFCIGLAAPEMVGKVVALLFLLPLFSAFLFGRVFCTSACPLGAVQHLFSRNKGWEIPAVPLRILRILPVLVLIATVWGALRGGMFIACKLDVYKTVFFTGHAWIDQIEQWVQGTLTEPRIVFLGDLFAWLILGAVLFLGFFVQRPFCRFACPYGVLLGIFSSIGLRRRSIDPNSCFSCIQCTKTCPTQAISVDAEKRTVTVSNFHCVQCGRCDETCTTDSVGTLFPYSDTGSAVRKKQGT